MMRLCQELLGERNKVSDEALSPQEWFRQHFNNRHVVLTGDYQRFSQINGFVGNMQELSMVGEVDRRLLLAYTPNEKRENAVLMLPAKTMHRL